MTAKQEAFYWQLWRRACAAQGWPNSDSERRHQVHVQALGFDVSHKEFTNEMFDVVIRALKLLANPVDLEAVMFQADPEKERRKRLCWRIKQTAAPEYIRSIAADKFGTIYWETDLDARQLEQLRNTVVNRMRAKANAQPNPMELALTH